MRKDPEKTKEYNRKWYAKNRDKINKNYRERYAKNNEKMKARDKKRYTEDPEKFNERCKKHYLEYKYRKHGLTSSDAKKECEICKSSTRRICIDHCHVTGKFRGFLCHNCNIILGMSKDNPDILRKCASYLEKF